METVAGPGIEPWRANGATQPPGSSRRRARAETRWLSSPRSTGRGCLASALLQHSRRSDGDERKKPDVGEFVGQGGASGEMVGAERVAARRVPLVVGALERHRCRLRGRTGDRRAATSCATIHGTTGSGSRCPPSAAWGRRSGRNRVGAAGGGWGAWATGAWRRCSMSGASVRGVPLPVRVEERSTVAVQGLSPCQTRRAAVALGVSSRTIGAKRYLRRWTRRCYPRAKLRPRQSTDRRSAGSQPPVAGERA
jgi:hypothetical protein